MFSPHPFNYTPISYDPELEYLKRSALFQGQQDQNSTRDDLNRAGLLGSGASFGVMGEQQNRTNRSLEDVVSNTSARRRSEMLDLYNRQNDYLRQRDLQEEQNKFSLGNLAMGAVGQIGHFAGGFLPTRASMFNNGLPQRSLDLAGAYQPSPPEPRRVGYM